MKDEAPTTLRDYLNVLWRQRWLVVLPLIMVPLAAFLFSSNQSPVYQASAGVLVNTQNLAANLAGISDPTQLNATRIVKTNTELARVPEVAARTVDAAGLEGWAPSDLLGISSVSSKEDSDILTFTVTSEDRPLAVALATEYARQFTVYLGELQTETIRAMRESIADSLAELEAEGERDSPSYASKLENDRQLETLQTLQTDRATLVRPATGAAQVEPQPGRSAVLGLALGMLLGVGLAFAREALDTRVRSADAVADELTLPLLGRIPQPPRALRKEARPVMLAQPNDFRAEAFRMLAQSVELANMETQARTIMVTSAVEQEGKSTTAANLAIAFARSGARVTLVDLDYRKPSLHTFFRLDQRPGLTDVALGSVELPEALATVDIGFPPHPENGNGRLRGLVAGTLDVLPSGSPWPQPEASTGPAFAAILQALAERSDLVLLDGPPLLRTGDALAASARVDALLVVTRLNVVRRQIIDELHRVLEASPAKKLGFVATGAETDSGYGYLTYSYHQERVTA